MKRRNVDANKYRKQFHFKKYKFAEGIYGSSTFIYFKFLCIWILIMIADFVLEFRFEFLWPFWLVIRSLNDSFKYQGILFSLFFALIVFFSDLIFYIFLPVQWLFFAASTYVWVQYVWHTEKGVCLPTVSLWLLFVYIEASFRLKNIKTIDLCRPFAAHCIGYPMVTLGFGFKSYLSYKLRLKRQKEIQKLNEFYIQLISKALPLEIQVKEKEKFKAINYEEEISSQSSSSLQTSSHQSNGNLVTENTNLFTLNTSSKEKHHKTSNIITNALSFYLNSTNNNNNTNNSISITNTEYLPFIQQKDLLNASSNSKSNNNNNINNIGNKSINKYPINTNDLNNFKNSDNEISITNSKNQSFNKPYINNHNNNNNSSNNNININQSNSNYNKSSSKVNEQLNCNLSSISISSLAYSSQNNQHRSPAIGINEINLNENGNLILLSSANNQKHIKNECSDHHHRSASSNSSPASNRITTNAYVPNNSNNHTNININMTINTTAIAAAAATASSSTIGSNNCYTPSTTNSNTSANNENITNNIIINKNNSNLITNASKKYKNKENRANSVHLSAQSCEHQMKLQQKKVESNSSKPNSSSDVFNFKDELIKKNLEEELNKLKIEIEQQKTVEQYLRNQINYITKCDRTEKAKIEKIQQENENLQTKLNQLNLQRQKEKDEITLLEKKLIEEKKYKSSLENLFAQEKKNREALERQLKQTIQAKETGSQAYSNQLTSSKINGNVFECCTEICRKKLIEYENENRILTEECRKKQDKNLSLQESLSAETRFKLDLFSALGETRRQLEAVYFQLEAKERELNDIKTIFKPLSMTNSSVNTNDQISNELINQYLTSQLNNFQTNSSSSPINSISSTTNTSNINKANEITSKIITNNCNQNGDINNFEKNNNLQLLQNGCDKHINYLNNGSLNYLPKI